MRAYTRLLLIFLLIGCAGAAFADTSPQIPINNQTVDYLSYVTKSINEFVTGHGDIFVGIASHWLTNFGKLALFLVALKFLFSGGPHFKAALFEFVFKFLLCTLMLQYYDAPMPWGGVNFHQLFTGEARYLAAFLDISLINDVLRKMHELIAGLQRPSAWDPVELFLYIWVLIEMWFMEAVIFAISAFGFVATGVMVVLGPLAIPFLMFESLAWIFWGWLRALLIYSFYRVTAAAYIYVWAHVMFAIFDGVFGGNFSLAHFLRLGGGLLCLLVAFVFGAFKVLHLTSDFFGGVASAGHSGFGGLMVAIRGLF